MANGAEIGRKIFLAQMDKIAAEIERNAPIIIDHELRVGVGAKPLRLVNLRAKNPRRRA